MMGKASLRQKATTGVLWSAFERFGQQGVGFLVQLVLARILAPEQFGLIAMVAVFVALCQGIADAGFHEAIIQKKELDDSLVSTVFFTNLSLSIFLAGALWMGAPLVSDFYDQPSLTALLRVLCLGLIIDGFARIQLTLLQREMLFRKLATATLIASLVSGVVSVILALSGFGVWALVWQILIQRSFVAILLWVQSSWRPQWLYSFASLKEVLPFASRMFASNILNTVFQQIYVLVIGRVGSPVDLGYYQRADSFKRLASQTSHTLMSRITFPLFAQVQDDPARLRRGFIKASQLLGFLFFPFMAVLAAVAEPLIVTLIGAKWLPAVPYLQLLCIIGALHPVHAINLSLIKALGQGRLFLRLELVKKSVIVMVLLVTFRHGVYVIVVGQLLSSLLALCINGFYTHRLIEISYWQQLKMYVGSVVLSIFVACAVSELLLLYVASAPIRLISALVLASVLWPLGVWLLRGIFTVQLDWFFGELARLPWVKKKIL
jgi:O-antigen/teichoic acid export membrane protein